MGGEGVRGSVLMVRKIDVNVFGRLMDGGKEG